MSQQETIIGKLKLLPKLKGESLGAQCKRICNEKLNVCDLGIFNDSWQERLSEFDFVIYNGYLYEVIERKDYGVCDIFDISSNKDGTYNFSLSYYNGGCSFSEAIERAFKRMKEE